MEELEDKIGAYHYYLQAVSRDGVPYNLIQDALPTIEGEVNNILSQIVDFGIIFKMDGKFYSMLELKDWLDGLAEIEQLKDEISLLKQDKTKKQKQLDKKK